MAQKYWLMKSEPSVFSIEDLHRSKNKTTYWDGVRNYQARNYLRDEIKKGDLILFYYSNAEVIGVAGICQVIREGYPDFTAFDSSNKHYDPKSIKENPTWYMVDIKLKQIFPEVLELKKIQKNKKLQGLKLLQRGNRLSVMPVTKEEFDEIVKMSKGK